MSPNEWIGVITAIAVLCGAFGKLYRDIRGVHELVNSRMTELLELTRNASEAVGSLKEREMQLGIVHKETTSGERQTSTPDLPSPLG